MVYRPHTSTYSPAQDNVANTGQTITQTQQRLARPTPVLHCTQTPFLRCHHCRHFYSSGITQESADLTEEESRCREGARQQSNTEAVAPPGIYQNSRNRYAIPPSGTLLSHRGTASANRTHQVLHLGQCCVTRQLIAELCYTSSNSYHVVLSIAQKHNLSDSYLLRFREGCAKMQLIAEMPRRCLPQGTTQPSVIRTYYP